jgi:hypothetical protein
MNITKGYGTVIRNVEITDKTNTVAYQQLLSLGIKDEDIVLDFARADYEKRPKLEALINSMDDTDTIICYSERALLTTNQGLKLYEKIIKKGIRFIVYDLEGGVARLSKLSNVIIKRDSDKNVVFEKTEKTFKELAEAIDVFAKSAKKNSGKMLDAPDRITPSEKFKKIYFAYESYQIDAKTTMRLLKEHCGIVNKVTFFLTAKDYERSIGYSKDLSDELYTICTLPKRCNSIPDEYYEICDCISKHIVFGRNMPEKVENAMLHLGIIGNYNMFQRWNLAAAKTPKPRKPIAYNFDEKML